MEHVRVAFAVEERDQNVYSFEIDIIEKDLREDPYSPFLRAEYVPENSPFVTWQDIRTYGYTCRAFAPIRRR